MRTSKERKKYRSISGISAMKNSFATVGNY